MNHASPDLPGLHVTSYSLELRDAHGWIGNRASQTAFREMLPGPIARLRPTALDRVAQRPHSPAGRALAVAIHDYAERLADVADRFLRHPAYDGVTHLLVGGGFKDHEVGRRAIRAAARRLAQRRPGVVLQPLHHEADDAGLAGWAQAVPPAPPGPRAIRAVDLGGTNVRCGIVLFGERPSEARVIARERWQHAADAPDQNDLVGGIAGMLAGLNRRALPAGYALEPFIGISCPGILRADGSIARGADNLPGDWHHEDFHLPDRLADALRGASGMPPAIAMHNDAVIQGLSERPFLRGVQRWAVLTVGTGLGNASFEAAR